MYYIYKIENLQNHKIYIGLTNNIARRRIRHFTDLRCHRHDNHFLQKQFDIYGEENFSFEKIFEGDVDYEQIGKKEKEYISFYDSYRNGYNQNEGGNFGPSNGGSTLTQSDIYNICAALEFCPKPGAVLSKIFNISLTTVSRIKHEVNHNAYINEYKAMPLEERKKIYKIFCDSTNFYETKINQTILKSKRKLTKDQVFMILYNFQNKIVTNVRMAQIVGVASTNTLTSIKDGISYKDYSYEYSKLNNEEKQKIVSLFSNE